MNQTLKKTGKWLADHKKIILIVVAVIVAVWIGRKAVEWFTRKANEVKIKNDAEQHTGTSVTSTMAFGDLINRLFFATWRIGTDEDEVYNVLGELRTQADWETLKRMFAEKFASANKVAQLNYITWGVRPTLIGTLNSELDGEELQHCREILQSKRIIPDF